MDPLLIVSPHLDDAVLSAGQLLAGRPDCVIVTVLAGAPDDASVQTTYDRDSGFGSAAESMAARCEEDRAAAARLRAQCLHLPFTDSQYGSNDAGMIEAALRSAIAEVGPSIVMVPLGLAHPDHQQIADTCRGMLAGMDIEAWLYEEMPYRVLQPELVAPALERWAEFHPVLGFAGTGPLREKAKAVRCYRSQLWALNMMAVLCPERHWRLWP